MSHNFQEVIDELHRGRELITSTSGTQGILSRLSDVIGDVSSRLSKYCSDDAWIATINLKTTQYIIDNIRDCISSYSDANEQLISRIIGTAQVSNTSPSESSHLLAQTNKTNTKDHCSPNDSKKASKTSTAHVHHNSTSSTSTASNVTTLATRLDTARNERTHTVFLVGRRRATVTAGYLDDGRFAGGYSSDFGCAEDQVVHNLGADPSEVHFTEAVRPRNGKQIAICYNCQKKYRKEQFPEGVLYERGGPWDVQRIQDRLDTATRKKR